MYVTVYVCTYYTGNTRHLHNWCRMRDSVAYIFAGELFMNNIVLFLRAASVQMAVLVRTTWTPLLRTDCALVVVDAVRRCRCRACSLRRSFDVPHYTLGLTVRVALAIWWMYLALSKKYTFRNIDWQTYIYKYVVYICYIHFMRLLVVVQLLFLYVERESFLVYSHSPRHIGR